MPRDGTRNLIPMNQRTEEEQRQLAIKGGKASGEARRLKRTFADILREILALDVDNAKQKELLEKLGMKPSRANALNLRVVDNAIRTGDIDAAKFIRDTIGEKPREGLEIGNLDDKPLSTIDMSKLSDDQLKMLIAKKEE